MPRNPRRRVAQGYMRKEPVIKKVRFVGLGVHAETIAVAVAEPSGEIRSMGTIPNRLESRRKLVKKLGGPKGLKACYEAGPTGYVVYWQLTQLGVKCASGAWQRVLPNVFANASAPQSQARFHPNRRRPRDGVRVRFQPTPEPDGVRTGAKRSRNSSRVGIIESPNHVAYRRG
jgi:hypothetical protein